MSGLPLDIVSLFRSQVPPQILEDLARCIRDASRNSAAAVGVRYAKDQASEARPWFRRAELNTSLLALNGAGANVRSEKSSGSTFYVPIEVGDFTILVARAIDAKTMLRQAVYRSAIATNSAQEDLFGPVPPPIGARMYAVILYGGPSIQADPEFIVVRFPTKDHGRYLDGQIHLKDEYAALFDVPLPLPLPMSMATSDFDELAAAASESPVEHIADETGNLKLRREPNTGSSEQT
jgi:hypothetical protein